MTPPTHEIGNMFSLEEGEAVHGKEVGPNTDIEIKGPKLVRVDRDDDDNPIIQMGGKMIIAKKKDFELDNILENAMGTDKEGCFVSNMTIEEERAIEMEEEFDPDTIPESTLKDFLITLNTNPELMIEDLMGNPEELLDKNDNLSSSDKTLILNSLSKFHESGSTDIIYFIRKDIEKSTKK